VHIAILIGLWTCVTDFRPANAGTSRIEVTVLSEEEAAKLLEPCSRPPVQGLTGYWHPDTALVAKMDAPLVRQVRRALARVVQRDLVKGISPADYRVQYAGSYLGSRRVIYANGVLSGSFIDEETAANFNEDAKKKGVGRRLSGVDWRSKAIGICDGGVVSFGVLYDVGSGRFSEFKFNGMLQGSVNLRAR
jgi:hypothetical protein